MWKYVWCILYTTFCFLKEAYYLWNCINYFVRRTTFKSNMHILLANNRVCVERKKISVQNASHIAWNDTSYAYLTYVSRENTSNILKIHIKNTKHMLMPIRPPDNALFSPYHLVACIYNTYFLFLLLFPLSFHWRKKKYFKTYIQGSTQDFSWQELTTFWITEYRTAHSSIMGVWRGARRGTCPPPGKSENWKYV